MLNRWRRAGGDAGAREQPASGQEQREPDDAALLEAVGRGDRERALPELYRRYERRLYGLGYRLLGDQGLAEELVQETFLRVWRTADRFDPARGTATAFVLTIARRLAIDLWRRPSSRRCPPVAIQTPSPMASAPGGRPTTTR